MDCYKVMLVDDEEEVRQAIERRVNWEEIGFKVVASAENGEDALEKAEKYVPDVVMSDIHMPFMDGLTFCHYLKKQFPGTRIIIFSGYDEFEYAKEAIKLEAEEYILKPIDAEELKQVFLRIKARLDEEYDKRRNLENLEKYYEESLPILKEQFLIGLLEGRIAQEYLDKYLTAYNFNIDASFFAVGVFEPAPSSSDETMTTQLLAVSLKQIVDEQLSKTMDHISINYLGRVITIGFLKSTASHKEFVEAIDNICKLSSKMLGVATSAGIGNTVGKIQDISQSFIDAQDALSYRVLFDENQALYIKDVEPGYSRYEFNGDSQINSLIKEIKIGTRDNLGEEIDRILDNLKRASISIQHIQLFCVEVYVDLMRLARSYDLDDEQLSALDMDVYNEVKSFNSPDELRDWLETICMTLRSMIRKERQDSTKLLVEKAKEYIRENYSDSELSVDRLCTYLSVSPTYFSSMFKKETGVSFVTYITNIRMEQAVHLLDSTDEKSYVIAGMIGYEDPNYFSYVFKKAYGISPSKYRSRQESTV